jgi:predicted enzyme related to lactoylglutathione lyase
MLQGLQFVILHVDDVDAARAFYTERYGLEVEAEQPGFVQFRQPGGGATFAVARTEAGTDPIELWWFVDDADAEHAALKARGVEVKTPPHDEPFGRAFTIKDASGAAQNLLQLPARG